MVEVPSLLFQLDELLERVDFLSVGSNDLVQFLYAIDRGNPRVADRFDALSAPVLRALKDIADGATPIVSRRQYAANLPRSRSGRWPWSARLSLAVAHAVGSRPGQGHAARPGCRKAAKFLCPLIERRAARPSARETWRNLPPITASQFSPIFY